MAKKKNRKVAKVTEKIDMDKYIDSLPVDDKCLGCAKVFTFVTPDTEDMQKCLAYINPSAKWSKAPVAEKLTITKAKGQTKEIAKMVPAVDMYCPLATHIEIESADDVQKVRIGQQKQNKA